MTVLELINALLHLPPDFRVIYDDGWGGQYYVNTAEVGRGLSSIDDFCKERVVLSDA